MEHDVSAHDHHEQVGQEEISVEVDCHVNISKATNSGNHKIELEDDLEDDHDLETTVLGCKLASMLKDHDTGTNGCGKRK
jgi:hypothetical protein